jgi:predicted metal-dependent hydrolase
MTTRLDLGDVTVDVVQKNIKNVHLSVHPPTGRVRISAPSHLSLDTIRVFAISKLDWIKRQQKKLRDQERETPREYLDHESHYVWGRRYLMKVVECNQAPSVELTHRQMVLRVRPGADAEKRQAVVEGWYRGQLRQAVPPLIAKWEPVMGVRVNRLFVQRMKTRWGSCNSETGSIRLNSDLAKKPGELLEYIVVHEMVHLLEASHNERFYKLMDRFMPNWRVSRDRLNRLPVTHDDWADANDH